MLAAKPGLASLETVIIAPADRPSTARAPAHRAPGKSPKLDHPLSPRNHLRAARMPDLRPADARRSGARHPPSPVSQRKPHVRDCAGGAA
jgi:hypothetical protein